ncbi:MAG TPA: NFACT RNA binding domain-containing protein [Candidatus Saccharimonadales bacterium]|nr:NFACT RNA binding domain-containing protein [Candidatus Saccharimonadales bacterium]
MSGVAEISGLVGREVRGVVPLTSRSLALSFVGPPRVFLWIHLDRKTAWYALAPDLPIDPDPRGSRFQAIEAPLRQARVAEERAREAGGLDLRFETGGEEVKRYRLTLDAEGPRVNLTFVLEPEGTVLWAFHREEKTEASPELREGYRPPTVRDASQPEARAELRALIEGAFLEEFRSEMERRFKAAERTLERRAAAAEEDLERAADMRLDRRRAEILLANFGKIARGASRVGLPDPFADSPRATVEINLDPSLSPDENAARLFQRARKGERGERRALARLTETRQSLSELAELRRDSLLASPREALKRIARFLEDAAIEKNTRGDVRETHLGRRAADAPRARRPGRGAPGAHKSLRPRTYVTSDGWEVWVGRSNTDNDLITHRLSNPHDFWFHVVGAPGSHVILRRPTRNSTPKPTTLVEAAQIAAFFSKARKQTRVPVIYTERKFVSKPRNGKPGQALCSREREILVRPLKPSTDPDG